MADSPEHLVGPSQPQLDIDNHVGQVQRQAIEHIGSAMLQRPEFVEPVIHFYERFPESSEVFFDPDFDLALLDFIGQNAEGGLLFLGILAKALNNPEDYSFGFDDDTERAIGQDPEFIRAKEELRRADDEQVNAVRHKIMAIRLKVANRRAARAA